MDRWPFLRSLRPGQVRSDPERDIHDEIELYLELRAEELEAGGMAPDEARRVARERFGDTDRVERELRTQARRRRARQRTTMTMGGLRQDLTYAFRTLRRSPGFLLVAVATLALALGGNTAIFTVVDAALLRALPFEDHEALVFLDGAHIVDGDVSVRGASFPEFRDWRERARSVSPMAALDGATLTFTGAGEAEQLEAEVVTADYFEVLGVSAALGRVFRPEEHAEVDAHSVALISYGLWERRWALDPSLLGADMIVNDRPLTVIGILPEGFGGANLTTEVWIPESLVGLTAGSDVLEERASRFLTVIGRLTPGSDVESAQAELDVIASDLQRAHPRDHEDRFVRVVEFREGYLGPTGGLLWILLGAGGLLLLIASANVANLLLVRAHGRIREFVLRRALGAEGSRVATQLVVESLVLAVAGGLAGIGVALVALDVLGPMIPAGVLPGYVEPRLSGTAFLTSLAVLCVIGLVTGLAPAVSSARADLAGRLREGGRSGTRGGPVGVRAQHAFVIAQVALALVLMVGAGLLTRSFRAQVAVDTGADVERIQALRLQLPNSRYDSGDVVWSFARELERQVAALPGVTSVALASDLPFRGGSSGSYILRAGEPAENRIRYHRHSVTPAYFETMGIELIEGRVLTDDDVAGTPRVAVITQAMVERVYPGESAVGKSMWLRPDGRDQVEIVGVIEDVRYRDVTTSLMADGNSPDVFYSYWQSPTPRLEVAVRASVPAETLASSLRGVVAGLDPDLPIFQLEPLEVAWRAQTATPRFAAFLMVLFGTLAGLLACVGIYGVLAFSVGERAQEIAIRRAIGASAADVARSVVGQGIALAGVGLVVGSLVALTASRVLERFLFGVAATDPVTFLSMATAVVAFAALAASLPALRATRRDPAEALNAE